MATLMDALKQSMQAGTQQAQPAMGETEQVKNLFQQKTGKAAAPSSGVPRQSNLTEAVQAGATRSQSQGIAQQGQLNLTQQQGQQADIDQRTAQQNTEFKQRRSDNLNKFRMQADNIVDQYNQAGRKLETDRDVENMEQIGFGARLANQQYVDKLQQEGQKARLDDQLVFKEQLTKDAFADMQTLLKNDLAFKSIMNASDRDFAEQLSQIDANIAVDMLGSEINAANQQSIWSGASGVVQGGLKAYDKYSDYQDEQAKKAEAEAAKTKALTGKG